MGGDYISKLVLEICTGTDWDGGPAISSNTLNDKRLLVIAAINNDKVLRELSWVRHGLKIVKQFIDYYVKKTCLYIASTCK